MRRRGSGRCSFCQPIKILKKRMSWQGFGLFPQGAPSAFGPSFPFLIPRTTALTMLWRDLRTIQIYGANTNVGKSIVSTLLCKAFKSRSPTNGVLYLKPVSTGPIEDADDRYVNISTNYGILFPCSYQDNPKPLYLRYGDVLINLTVPRHISRFARGVRSENLYQFQDPVSPHLAAQQTHESGGSGNQASHKQSPPSSV
jgi:hypothetical protein